LKRTATGVAGLDEVLDGGLEPGAVVVIAGGPGTGKTILAQQMGFAIGTAERKCVYYTTVTEPHAKLVSHLETFAFFDSQSLGLRVEYIHLGDMLQPESEDGLQLLVSEIIRKKDNEEPALVVLDSAKMLRDFADERRLRRALYDLTGSFAHSSTILLLIGEYTADDLGADVEFAVADAIIQMEYEVREPIDRRSLRVVKMRGGRPLPGKQTFQIGTDGIRVFPRIETLIPATVAPVSGRISSGIPGLDALMAGGMKAGNATLVMGPSGVGKTTMGMRWLAQGLKQGDHCLFVTLQDSGDHLIEMAAIFGWDVATASAAGQLTISSVPTGDLDMDVLADTVRASLAASPVRRVVIDSLAELILAAREWDRFPAYMRSLVGIVRASGSSILVTSETTASGLAAQSMERLMFLFDNVIDFRYIEDEAGLGRAVNIVKMRNGAHQMSLNRAAITASGVEVGDPIEGASGRLGWSALRSPYTPAPAPQPFQNPPRPPNPA
jgi:circadian clock protein KaiC